MMGFSSQVHDGGGSPNVAKVLTDTFGIAGIGTVEEDLNRFFG